MQEEDEEATAQATSSGSPDANRSIAAPDVVAGAALVGAWSAIGAVGDTRSEPLAFLAGYAVASAAYAWIAWRVVARGRRPSLTAIAVVALLARAAVLPAPPSDDMARYVWEGRVVVAGESPYLLAPDAPALAPLAARAPEHAGINHPSWTAIYPPFAMAWHAGLAALAPSSFVFKASFVGVELVVAALVLALLRRRGRPDARVALYLLNPLVIWAVALEGHHEPLAAAWLLAALVALDRRRDARAGAAWALACASKAFPVVAVVALVGRTRVLRAAGGALAAAALVTAPFASSGAGLVASLSRFGTELSVNDTLHAVARAALPPTAARIALATVGLAVAAWLVLGRRRRSARDDATWEAAVLLGTLVLLLPTVHPWYLYGLVPLLCLWPWPGWLALTCTVALTWLPHLEIRHTGTWVEWRELIPLEYAPLFAWLAIVAWRRARPRARAIPRT